MHFEPAKDDAGHYHKLLELRDDAGQLAGQLLATASGITLLPAAGWIAWDITDHTPIRGECRIELRATERQPAPAAERKAGE
jgi:hypothetical protein